MSFTKFGHSKMIWLLACAILPGSAAGAQGMMEMGAVNSMSAGMGNGLFNSALPNALGNSMSRSAGATSGAAISGVPLGADGEPDLRVMYKTGAKDANHLYQMGMLKQKAGMWKQAEECYKQSLYIRERLWADQDPAVVKITMLVGDMAMKLGNFKEADECYKRALSTCVRQYGSGEYPLVEPLLNLGKACFAEKKYNDSCNYLQQAYLLRSRKLGDANNLTTDAAITLGKAYMENDSAPEAAEMLKKVIDAHSGSNTPQMVAMLEIYDKALLKQHKNDEAARVELQLQSLKPAQPPNPDAAAATNPGANNAAGGTSTHATTSTTSTSVAPGATPASAPASSQATQITKSEKQDAPKTTTETKSETVTK